MKLALAMFSLAAAAVAASAQSAPPAPAAKPLASPMSLAPGACFRTRDIRNHTLGDARTLYLNVNDRAYYRVVMRGACLAGAVSSDPLIMREPPGTAIVCRAMDLDISLDKGGFVSPCIIDSVAAMTPAEVEALPRKLRP